MKIFSREKIIKQVLAILLVFMISFTTFQPIITADNEFGGILFSPIVNLLKFVADLVIELLQDFLWDGSNINGANNYEIYIRTSNNIYK